MHGSDKALPQSAARECKIFCVLATELQNLLRNIFLSRFYRFNKLHNKTINNPHPTLRQLLINSTSPAANEIGYELGIIKANFGREIAALKSAVSGDVSMRHCRHVSSSSFTSLNSTRDAPSESIKSPAKWNERVQEICDKFSTIIDDGKESNCDDRSDEEASRSMMAMKTTKEIDNAPRRNSGSIGSASSDVLLLLPQDESFN